MEGRNWRRPPRGLYSRKPIPHGTDRGRCAFSPRSVRVGRPARVADGIFPVRVSVCCNRGRVHGYFQPQARQQFPQLFQENLAAFVNAFRRTGQLVANPPESGIARQAVGKAANGPQCRVIVQAAPQRSKAVQAQSIGSAQDGAAAKGFRAGAALPSLPLSRPKAMRPARPLGQPSPQIALAPAMRAG